MSDSPGKHKYKSQIWIQHRASHRWDNDGWTYIYHMGKRPNRCRCQFHYNKGKADNNVPDLTAYKRSNNKVFVYLQKIWGGCWLINRNTPRKCCSHTSWGYSNCKQMMSNSTESNGSFDKECPTGSSNESFSLHQHDAQDNNSWSKWPLLPLCVVVQFNGPKTLITLKNTAASYLLSI